MTEPKAFFDAIRTGNLPAVTLMLDQDRSLRDARNAQSQSATLVSVYHGRKEIRDLLVARGASLEFHEAAAAGQFARVREFIEQDAALSGAYSPDGFPPAALAAAFGHLEIVKYLVLKGAAVNAVATNGSGYNALTGAVAGGHLEIARWLLENGADANYRYAAGFSPLLTAAANGHLEMVKLLLAKGADPSARTDDQKSALSLAEERHHSGVAEFLRGRDRSAPVSS